MSKIISARFTKFRKQDLEKFISFSEKIPRRVISVKKRSWYAGDLKRFQQTPITMGLIAHPNGDAGTSFIIAYSKINQIQYSENNQTTPFLFNQQDLDLTIEKSRFRNPKSIGWQNYSFYFDNGYNLENFERNSQAIFFPS
jgi:hypothetical protein